MIDPHVDRTLYVWFIVDQHNKHCLGRPQNEAMKCPRDLNVLLNLQFQNGNYL